MNRPNGQDAEALRAMIEEIDADLGRTIEEIDADLGRKIEEIQTRSAAEIRAAVAEANRRRRGLEPSLVLIEMYNSRQARVGQGDAIAADHAKLRRPTPVDDKLKRIKVSDDGVKKKPSSEVILSCLIENGGRASTATVRKAVLLEGWTNDAGVKSRVRLRERGLILIDGDDLVLTDRARSELMEVEVD